jgi:phosphoglycolate phosphatase-like HAD superfamily hydrolase
MRRAHEDPRLAPLFQRAGCVFFDCDGIIYDSNGFKQRAMRHALAGQEERALAEMSDFWRRNGGMSRFAKLQHFFTHIAPHPEVAGQVALAAQRFGEYSRAGYDECAPIAAALRAAEAAGAARCHVVSGAAQTELESVFAAHGIASRFASILGSPRPKQELVSLVLAAERCPPERALLIGDGAMDFRVCQALGLHFVYLAELSEWLGAREQLAAAEPVTVAESWQELLQGLGVPAPVATQL